MCARGVQNLQRYNRKTNNQQLTILQTKLYHTSQTTEYSMAEYLRAGVLKNG